MSHDDELQTRTNAFADLSSRFIRSTSAASNYRAARRARSHHECVATLGIVSEEADESVFWLKRLMNVTVHDATVELGMLLAEAQQLARIFGASHRTAKKRTRR
jgi:four helix bundle protein